MTDNRLISSDDDRYHRPDHDEDSDSDHTSSNESSVGGDDGPSQATPKGTKWWSAEDDLILLIQANNERPFLVDKSRGAGGLMAAWEKTAASILQVPGFSRPELSGKKASTRFGKLLAKHRKFQKTSKYSSGTSEDETDSTKLLDEIVSLVDDHAVKKTKELESKKAVKSKQDDAARYIRDQAMQRCSKKPTTEGESPSPTGKKKLINDFQTQDMALEQERIEFEKAKLKIEAEQREKDRAEREKDRADRAKEREEEREERARIREEERQERAAIRDNERKRTEALMALIQAVLAQAHKPN
ncbi:hypothetical protein ACHHYP_11204 [Achlya hypogyna]|uniref:Myb-like domain-containing protein n=1 Tax=Achlya hypogyna TaxID=1202772 RepID=A0A1V9YJP3_ACHHY|nr:hypothetical protein ACHHYP_11204 [Achlya hypogyna]